MPSAAIARAAALLGLSALMLPLGASAAPDLVCDITYDPDVNALTFTVTNKGDAPAVNDDASKFEGALFWLDLPAGETPAATTQNPSDAMLISTLAVNASQTLTLTAGSPGPYTAWCAVNPLSSFQNEQGLGTEANEFQLDYTVPPPKEPQPDLVITGVAATSTDGLKFTFEVSVENKGTADAGTFDVDLYPDSDQAPDYLAAGKAFCTFAEGLAKGKSGSCTVTWTYPGEGTYHAWVTVDQAGLLAEPDENNGYSVGAVVAGPADLEVSDFQATTTKGSSTVSYAAYVKNTGGIGAADVTVCLWTHLAEPPKTGDKPSAKKVVQSLPANGPATVVAFSVDGVPNGDRTGWIQIDCDAKVVEGDEVNNVASTPYFVDGPENVAPAIAKVVGSATCVEAMLCHWSLTLEDESTSGFTFEVLGGPVGMFAAEQGEKAGVALYVPPLGSARDGVQAVVRVTDPGGLTADATVTFTIIPNSEFQGIVGGFGAFPNSKNSCPMVEVPGLGFAYVRADDSTISFLDATGQPTGALALGDPLATAAEYTYPDVVLACHAQALPKGGFALLDVNGDNNQLAVFGNTGGLLRTIDLDPFGPAFYADFFILVPGTSTLALLDVDGKRLVFVDALTGKADASWGGNKDAEVGKGTPGVLDLYTVVAKDFALSTSYLWSDGTVIRVLNAHFNNPELVDFGKDGTLLVETDLKPLLPPAPKDSRFMFAPRDGGIQILDLSTATLRWYDADLSPHLAFTVPPQSGLATPGWVYLENVALLGQNHSVNNLACEALAAGGFSCHDWLDERGFIIDEQGQFFENCPDLDVSPKELNFGGVPANTTKTVDLLISNKGGGVLYILPDELGLTADLVSLYDCTKGIFNVDPPPPTLLFPGQTLHIPVSFSPTKPCLPEFLGSLTLTSNACGSEGIAVVLKGLSGPHITVTPDPIVMDGAKPGKTVRHVVVGNNGSSALKVNSVTICESPTPNPFSLQPATVPGLQLQPGQTLQFDVTYDSTKQGVFKGKLCIESSAPGQNPRQVDLEARTAALMRAKPAGFGFGEVPLGETKQLTVKLTNLGYTPVVLGAPTLSGPSGFVMNASKVPGTLAQSVSTELSVSYTAQFEGSAVARITIPRDGPGEPPLVLMAVAGTGTHLPQGFDGTIAFTHDTGAFGLGHGVIELSSGGFAAYGMETGDIQVVTDHGEADPWFGEDGRIPVNGPGGAFASVSGLGGTLVEMACGGFALLSSSGAKIYTVTPDGSPNPFIGQGGVLDVLGAFPTASAVGQTLIALPNEDFAVIDKAAHTLLVLKTDGNPDTSVGSGGIISLTGTKNVVPENLTGVGDTLSPTSTDGFAFGDTGTGKLFTLASAGNYLNSGPAGVPTLAGTLVPLGKGSHAFYDAAAGIVTKHDEPAMALDAAFGLGGKIDMKVAWPDATLGSGVVGLESGDAVAVTDTVCDCLRFAALDGTAYMLQTKLVADPPTALDFKRVPVGQTSAPQSVSVQNAGTYPLTLHLLFTSTEFQEAEGAATVVVKAGATLDLPIVFKPVQPGTKAASLTIVTNDPEQPVLGPIALKGSTGPHLVLDPEGPVLDFGSVAVGAEVEKTVLIRNNGADPLEIDGVTVEGAAVFTPGSTMPAAEALVAPGGAPQIVKVRCAPKANGAFNGWMTISHDDVGQPPRVVVLSCRSGPEVQVTPDSLACTVPFGVATTCGTVNVKNVGTAPLTFAGALAHGEGLSAEAEAGVLLPGDPPRPVTIHAVGLHHGTIEGALSVVTDDTVAKGVTELPITVTVPGALELAPAAIDFGAVPVGGAVELPVAIANLGGLGDVAVTAVTAVTLSGSADSSAFDVVSAPDLPATLPAGASANMTVRCAPSAAGASTGTLVVATSAPGFPILTAPLACHAGAHLVAAPSMVDFGAAGLNDTLVRAVTITNIGQGVQKLSAPTTAGDTFGVKSPVPAVLGPGESTTIFVTFHPSSAAAFDGELRINPFPVGAPLLTVPLHGRSGAAVVLATGGDPLDFGTRPIGSQTHGLVVAMNLGSVPTSVSGALVVPVGPFSLLTPPGDKPLAPWQALAFDVVYAPPSQGSYTTSLAITPSGGVPLLAKVTGRAGGVLAVGPTELEFGEVPLGTMVTLPLVVTNLSDVLPITVHAAVLGHEGDFTLEGIDPSGLVLGPGDVAPAVSVSFTPSLAGERLATFTFFTDHGVEAGSVDVVASGRSGGRVKLIYPATAFHGFEDVAVGTPATRPVHVASVGQAPVRLVGASLDGGGGALGIDPGPLPRLLARGEVAALTVSCNPPKAGTFSGTAHLQTDDPARPDVAISLACATESAVALTPSTLAFGGRPKGTPTSLPVTLTNTGSTVLTLASVSIPDVGTKVFTVAAPTGGVLPGQSVELSVKFLPKQVGTYAAKLVVVTSDPVHPVAEVPLSGASGPKLVVSPTAVNFCLGGAPAEVTLENAGSEALQISKLSFAGTSDAQFTALLPGQAPGEPPPLPLLLPGETSTVTLTIKKYGGQKVTGDALQIQSTDPASPVTSVRVLFGKGLVIDNGFTGISDVGPPGAPAFISAKGLGPVAAELCTGGLALPGFTPPARMYFAVPVAPGGAEAVEPWGQESGFLELGPLSEAAGLDPALAADLGGLLTSLADGRLVVGSSSLAAYVFVGADGAITQDGVVRLGPLLGSPALGGAFAERPGGFVVVDRQGGRVVALTTEGGLDTTFDKTGFVSLAAFQPSDTVGEAVLVLGGGSIAISDGGRDAIYVLKSTGAPDTAYGQKGLILLDGSQEQFGAVHGIGPALTPYVKPGGVSDGLVVLDQATDRLLYVLNNGAPNIALNGTGVAQLAGPTGLFPYAGGLGGAQLTTGVVASAENAGQVVLIDAEQGDLLFVDTDGTAATEETPDLAIGPCPIVLDTAGLWKQAVTLRNVGDAFLQLTANAVVSSADVECTGDGCAKGGNLKPGDVTVLNLKWLKGGESAGCFDATLTVSHNGSNSPLSCPIVLKSDAKVEVLPTPNDVKIGGKAVPDFVFPPQAVGSAFAKEILIRNRGCETVSLTGVELGVSTNNRFSLVLPVALPAPIGPGETVKVHVVCEPKDDDVAKEQNTVQIGAVGVTIPDLVVECVSGARLKATPETIEFGAVDVGTVGVKSVTLANLGGVPLHVTGVTPLVEPAFAVPGPFPVDIPIGKSATLDVTFTPTESKAYPETKLTFESDGVALASVKLKGTAGPVASFAENPYDFGWVASAAPHDHDVGVTNTGAGLLALSECHIEPEGTWFTVDEPGFSALAAGKSDHVTVHCTPSADGVQSADMVCDAGKGQTKLGLKCASGACLASVEPAKLIDFEWVTHHVAPPARVLTFTNPGSAGIDVTLAIEGAEASAAAFTVEPSVHIDPNSTAEAHVTFDPATVGLAKASLTVSATSSVCKADFGPIALHAYVTPDDTPAPDAGPTPDADATGTGDGTNPEASGGGDTTGADTGAPPPPGQEPITSCGCRLTPASAPSSLPVGSALLVLLAVGALWKVRRRAIRHPPRVRTDGIEDPIPRAKGERHDPLQAP